jgi:hypothetical protein
MGRKPVVADQANQATFHPRVTWVATEMGRRIIRARVLLGFGEGVAFQAAKGGFYGDDLVPGDAFRHG